MNYDENVKVALGMMDDIIEKSKVPGTEVSVEVSELIDYCLTNFSTDWSGSATLFQSMMSADSANEVLGYITGEQEKVEPVIVCIIMKVLLRFHDVHLPVNSNSGLAKLYDTHGALLMDNVAK